MVRQRIRTHAGCMRGLSIMLLVIASFLLANALITGFANASSHLPKPVDNALTLAEKQGDMRISFTMKFIWQLKDGPDIEITQRYDANSQQWQTISGDIQQLSGRARERLKKYKRLESKPGGLLYSDYRKELSDVTLVNEANNTLTYTFSSPRVPNDFSTNKEAVDTELVIDRNEGWMKKYSITILKPYKPNLLSNLDAFTFTQKFERPFEDGPALMTDFYYRMKGKTAFKSVDEAFSIKFSDFEIIS